MKQLYFARGCEIWVKSAKALKNAELFLIVCPTDANLTREAQAEIIAAMLNKETNQ